MELNPVAPKAAGLGGKAEGLLRLQRAGAQVPPFVVLPSSEFRSQVAAVGLGDALTAGFAALNAARDDPQGRQRAAESIAETAAKGLLKTPLSDAAVELIRVGIAPWGESPIAVRSSMVGEDSETASFAGQLETFLFCRGLDEVGDAVRSCWSAAFSPRVLLYRLRHEDEVGLPQMGVVVQEMVHGEVSGVLFTAHPVSGRRDHALLTAAWGLGEGVVSGACNTDEFTWAHGQGEVGCSLATKDLQLLPKRDGGPGTEEVAVEEELQRVRCLSTDQVRRLCEEALRLAGVLGAPQDLEWTFRGDELFLLQTRPITRLPDPPTAPPPLTARVEVEAPPNEDGPVLVFDNSNIQESYCGVTTPLTFSFASEAYASVYEQTMVALGIGAPVIEAHRSMLRNLLGLVRGRVYYNINNWYRGLLLLPSFGTNKADMEAMMGLTEPVDFIEDRVLGLGAKLRRLPSMLLLLLRLKRQFGGLSRSVESFLSDFEAAYAGVDREELQDASFAGCMAILDHLRTTMLDRWHVPIVNDFYVMMATGRLRRLLGEPNEDLFIPLMSGEEGIESTEPTKVLLRLASEAREDEELSTALQSASGHAGLEAIRSLRPQFAASIDHYLERYGDRCMGELKLETVSLREDPSFVFRVLVQFLGRPDLNPEALAAREKDLRGEAEGALRGRLGLWTRLRARPVLRQAREAVRNRENMRLARTRMFGLYRDTYRALGRRLAEVGRLDAPRDVFYLSTEEVRAYYEGRSLNADLAAVARARKAEFSAYEALDSDHRVLCCAPVYHGNSLGQAEALEVDTKAAVLQGTGCYPGTVEAPLRVILSPQDELDVGGRILCTVRTDPGWAPLFPSSSGILVERGSTLSHSAVVARELGIPAVVGVPGLLSIVEDGERVRLDGGSGRVERLDLAEGS